MLLRFRGGLTWRWVFGGKIDFWGVGCGLWDGCDGWDRRDGFFGGPAKTGTTCGVFEGELEVGLAQFFQEFFEEGDAEFVVGDVAGVMGIVAGETGLE